MAEIKVVTVEIGSANGSFAIGRYAHVTHGSASSLAIGANAYANGSHTTAIGAGACSIDGSVAIGAGAWTYGYNAVAIGSQASVYHNAIAIGCNSMAQNNAISIGANAHANGNQISFGFGGGSYRVNVDASKFRHFLRDNMDGTIEAIQ